MKKIIALIMLILLSAAVTAAWDAQRSITGNDVAVTITPADGFDTFTLVETVQSASIVSNSWGSSSCGLFNNKLTCDFDGVNPGTITYQTTGTGSVSGTIDAVDTSTFASDSMTVGGDTQIPGDQTPSCGNGVLETGEQCDDSNTVDGDGCSSTCQSEKIVPASVCGDGIKTRDEQCDDGNTVDGDGCSSTCMIEQTPDQILMDAISSIIHDSGKNELQKISAIAAALRTYFSS